MDEFKKTNDIFQSKIKVERKKDWESWVLLLSDVHFDSKHCDRKLLKKHLDEAKEKNAQIFIFGDLWDCMGGKYDPRSGKGDLRPEYQVKDYFDEIVRDAIKFFKPYKDNIKLVTYGNHELSVLKRQEVDLLKNFTERLGIQKGEYSGFVRFSFSDDEKKRHVSTSKLLYYNHGSGGNSPVTRGVIKTNRRQNYISADYFVSGHIHSEWLMALPMVSVNQKGKVIKKEQTHISLGTYKDDHGSGGWADMKEFPPPSMGGSWIKFEYDNDNIKESFIRAK
ncbi:metallophosphoesterase [Marinilabilia salmonicolor]|uniref:Calcineurin-like phosphoesterase family protein n=1 Tax=Marinilabilia salmonicolor TaxID=989 RepID=A0A368VDA8_9BACT|nr:metallophosphoesterase [Marinilabilia salmonicolor]RCW38673.1 calcineurin-like phosphoesterase family protein [Marinilabilia salmonicolor]